jgi:hypothetical protein
VGGHCHRELEHPTQAGGDCVRHRLKHEVYDGLPPRPRVVWMCQPYHAVGHQGYTPNPYLDKPIVTQDNILEGKEISHVLSTCKSLATAYHSSLNFARAIHEAQAEVREAIF